MISYIIGHQWAIGPGYREQIAQSQAAKRARLLLAGGHSGPTKSLPKITVNEDAEVINKSI
jgi:hypothetical protein